MSSSVLTSVADFSFWISLDLDLAPSDFFKIVPKSEQYAASSIDFRKNYGLRRSEARLASKFLYNLVDSAASRHQIDLCFMALEMGRRVEAN